MLSMKEKARALISRLATQQRFKYATQRNKHDMEISNSGLNECASFISRLSASGHCPFCSGFSALSKRCAVSTSDTSAEEEKGLLGSTGVIIAKGHSW